MMPAVQFNNQFPLKTTEIHYIATDFKLSSEFQSQIAIPNRVPEFGFPWRLVSAQLPGYMHCYLTLNLSVSGEGKYLTIDPFRSFLAKPRLMSVSRRVAECSRSKRRLSSDGLIPGLFLIIESILANVFLLDSLVIISCPIWHGLVSGVLPY